MTASIFNLFSRGLSHLAAMSKFDLGGNSTAYAKKQHRKNFQEFISSMVDAILSHSGTLIVQAYSLLLCLKLPSFNSAQFSHLVVSDSLRLQDYSPPCPSPVPGVYPNSCPSTRWCHPTISSSVIPFSSCLQSFIASGSFPMSQLFASGGQNTGVSASTSVLPMNTQDWFPLGWTGWISLQSKGLSKSSPTPQFKGINSSVLSFLYITTLTSITDYWKNHSFD